MRSPKSRPVQAFLSLEAKRIVRAAANPRGGDKIKGQVRSASRALGVPFDMAQRAWHGRIGYRAFPVLYQAWRRFEERNERDLKGLWARLDRLEREVRGANHPETSDLDSAGDT